MSRKGVDDVAAYRMMLRMRLVEEAVVAAWADGHVPGEYHSGIGEEAINAGVLLHLRTDDALSLDHRNTAPLIGRGTDPESLVRELVGSESGMNGGMAGHMHLIDPEVRATSDGIVGAAGPLALGQAIAGRVLRPRSVAVAFHGDGAINQGMLMEAYNLAVAWRLPVLFVCKDNKWAITTRSDQVSSTGPVQRARAFGLPVRSARGEDVGSVYAAAESLIDRARAGGGPGFLHVTCHRPGGHFEGDPIVRALNDPVGQARELLPGVRAAFAENAGRGLRERSRGAAVLGGRMARAAYDWGTGVRKDPVVRARKRLSPHIAERIERTVTEEINDAVARAVAAVCGRPVFGARASEVQSV